MRNPILSERRGPYLLALTLVLLGWGARAALGPVLGFDHSYTVFYPGVILAAYFLGARPAALTAVLSAACGYWFFAHPVQAWKADPSGLTTLAFFALTSSVSVYFITGMGRALKALAAERVRAEALAHSHATLFQELNERVTNHLQLVAALLQVQARDEGDPALSLALAEASTRTLLISRVHRNLAGDDHRALDFDAFARQLVEVTLAARGNPPVRVDLQRGGLLLPPDQATSVAIVLLECLNARLDDDSPAALRIRLAGDDRELVLEIAESGGGFERPVADPFGPIVEAMVEQLGGRFTVRLEPEGPVRALTFPRLAAVRGLSQPTTLQAATLH
jgi:two-component sensor histidine kinase